MTNYKVTKQGTPKIYGSVIQFAMPDTVAICGVDLDAKGYEAVWTGSNNGIPLIGLAVPKKGDWTELQFPTLEGWDIWCAEISRYTLRICFVKSK